MISDICEMSLFIYQVNIFKAVLLQNQYFLTICIYRSNKDPEMRVSQNSEHIKGIELQNLHKNFITRISVNLVDGLCALCGSKLHLVTYWVYNIKI